MQVAGYTREITSIYANAMFGGDSKKLSLHGKKMLGIGLTESAETKQLRLQTLLAHGEFDLQMLNRQAQYEISDKYKDEMLRLHDVFEKGGAPSLSLPTKNPYNEFYNYLIDPITDADPTRGVHPMSVALGRASISIKTGGGIMEDAVKTARGKGMTVTRARQLAGQSRRMLEKGADKGLNIYGVNFGVADDVVDLFGSAYDKTKYDIALGEEFFISTMDIETTGITPDSQTRTVSILRRRARYQADGTLEYLDDVGPKDIRSFHIGTTRMNAARAYAPDGSLQPLSEVAMLREFDPTNPMATKVAGGGEETLDALSEVLRYVTGADIEEATGVAPKVRLAGHNVGIFDIKFMTNNMLEIASDLPGGMPAASVEALTRFNQHVTSNPFFITDTMDAAFISMSGQAGQIAEMLKANGLVDDVINNVVYQTLIDKSLRTKAAITGERSFKTFC